MRADRRDPIIAALRKHKPHKFEAVLRDGTKKTIPLSTKANRWELLSELLDAIPWVSIEALDTDGQTLGAVEREGDFDEGDPDIIRAEGMSRVILQAITVAMQETRKMFADTMKANADMARSMLESQHVVIESYQLAMKVQAASIGSPEEKDNVMEMMKMAMMLRGGGTPSLTVTAAPPGARPKVANGKPG